MKDQEQDNCPKCGCGFILDGDDGEKICLYCPHRWHTNQTVGETTNE